MVLARATLSIANWIATLISGTPSPMFHEFLTAYVRYVAHLVAYLTLAADPYPGFTGRPGLPDRRRDRPAGPQNRWVTGFRLLLALPAILLADTLLGFGTTAAGGSIGTRAAWSQPSRSWPGSRASFTAACRRACAT